MKFDGKVIKYGDNVDTDVIIPVWIRPLFQEYRRAILWLQVRILAAVHQESMLR